MRSNFFRTAVVLCGLAILVSGCRQEPGDMPQFGSSEDKSWDEHTHGLPFTVGYEKGMQAAKDSGKPALLFVTTTWCGWCKKLAEDNFNEPNIRPLLDQFELVLVDGDVEKAAARSLNTQGYPHIVLQSPSGEVLEEISGYREPKDFRPLLESALAKSPAPTPSADEDADMDTEDSQADNESAEEKDWSEHTHGLPFVFGYENGLKAAEESGKPTLVFVTTTWCGWCTKLAKDNFDDPTIRPLLEQFTLVLVDGDVEKEANKALNVSGYPHIVLLSPSGETVLEILGYREKEDFRKLLETAL